MHVEYQAERKCGRKRDKLFDIVFTEAPTMRGARAVQMLLDAATAATDLDSKIRLYT
jgi:hypothetical protein